VRTTLRFRLVRDWVRYRLSRHGAVRQVLAENVAVWREVLARSSPAV
jgi:hypothetical protein